MILVIPVKARYHSTAQIGPHGRVELGVNNLCIQSVYRVSVYKCRTETGPHERVELGGGEEALLTRRRRFQLPLEYIIDSII